jgi:hypothetical protein
MNIGIDLLHYNIIKTTKLYKIIDIDNDLFLIKIKYVVNKLIKYRKYPNYFNMEEYYKATNIFTNYINVVKKVKSEDFLLLFCVCIFIASKFDDDFSSFDIDNINYITNNKYSIEDILSIEIDILKNINYNLFFYSVFNYNIILKKILLINEENDILINYLSDYYLLSSSLLKFNYFMISLSIIILSNLIINKSRNIEDIYDYSNEYFEKLKLHNILIKENYLPTVELICKYLIKSISNYIRNKYLYAHKDNINKYYKHDYIFNKYNYDQLIKKFIKNNYSSIDL